MTRESSPVASAAWALAGLLALAGCGTSSTESDSGNDGGIAAVGGDAGAGPLDASFVPDAAPADAANEASLEDSGPTGVDGSPFDASPPRDAAPPGDAAPLADAGPADSDGDGTPDPNDCAPKDPTRWQNLSYAFRDADGDSYTVAQTGSLCSGATLPAGYDEVANGDDCDDTNPSVYVVGSVFLDSDGDGVGAGAAISLCIGTTAPIGYSLTGTDCAPSDPTLWQELAFEYRDADGDGYTVGLSGQMCSGAALPAGYSTQANGNDCDDANPAIWDGLTVYADVDGDGVGDGTAILVCTDGSDPAGDVSSDSDCAPNDPTKWQILTYSFVDADGDGATVAETGTICAGATLPPPYYATAHGNDCDDADPALTQWEIVYPDADGDGTGALPLQILCEGDTFPAGYSRYGDDEDDTNASIGPLPTEDIVGLVLD